MRYYVWFLQIRSHIVIWLVMADGSSKVQSNMWKYYDKINGAPKEKCTKIFCTEVEKLTLELAGEAQPYL